MSDIVERLNLRDDSCSYVENIYKDAADEILRLRAENEKLRAALKPFADMAEKQAKLCLGPDIDHWLIGECDLTLGDLRTAAAALKETGK